MSENRLHEYRTPARLELPLLDPQVACEFGIVAPHLLNEALGILAANERLDGVAERGRREAGASRRSCSPSEL
jgi:hypothetical protein